MMDIFNEISWTQFQKLKDIAKLSLNEQVKKYNQYLYELSIARYEWLSYQNKGPLRRRIIISGYLLQEDLFDLEQEDGNKILITEYA